MARIDTAIWADPTFRALSPDAKLLYVWALTNPRCSTGEPYRIAPERIQRETSLSAERHEQAMGELVAAGLMGEVTPFTVTSE